MLELVIPSEQKLNNAGTITDLPEIVLRLEHSLVSLSKWEAKFEKPFLSDNTKSAEEILYYIQCMCLDEKVTAESLLRLGLPQIEQVNAYLSRTHTATWFSDKTGKNEKDNTTITSELIYYWMVSLSIPFTCETWNLNRLLTLVRIINVKNQPEKKPDKAQALARQRELNRQRREQLGSDG